MAVLALGLAGAGIGSTVGMAPMGFLLGTAVANLLFPGNEGGNSAKPQDGRLRLNDNLLQTSSYGAVIPLGYGLYRAAGNVIWSSGVEEAIETITIGTISTGKGGAAGALAGGSSTQASPTRERKFLKASIAIAFAEIPQHRLEDNVFSTTQESQEDGDTVNITERKSYVGIRRIWLNNFLVRDWRSDQLTPPDDLTIEEYLGDESQMVSGTIEGFEGAGNVPAYRNTLYVVIPDLELTAFGNALPAASAELYERADRIDNLEEGVEGLALSPDQKFLWVTSHTKRVIQKVDVTSLSVVARPGRDTQAFGEYLGLLPPHPWRCATSPDGQYVWVVHKGDKKLTRVSTANNTWVSYNVDKKYAMDVTVDSSNNVWVAYPFYNMVTKYNSSGVKQFDVSVTDAPWTVGYDSAYDAVWVGGSKNVHRISVASGTLVASINTGRYFHSDHAFGTRNSDLWTSSTGNDVATLIDRNNNTYRRARNTPTYPIGADCNPLDTIGSIYIACFSGNRLRAFSFQARAHFNAGTIAFPGQCIAMPNGKCFVTNTRLGIVQQMDFR
jgi:sugar lactone lactonase YvrE